MSVEDARLKTQGVCSILPEFVAGDCSIQLSFYHSAHEQDAREFVALCPGTAPRISAAKRHFQRITGSISYILPEIDTIPNWALAPFGYFRIHTDAYTYVYIYM